MQLCISSYGGYVSDGIFLYNHIRGLPLRVVAHNIGSVTSIAVAVFLAAHERYCSSLGMFMIHPTVMSSKDGMSAQRLQSSLDFALADDRRTENILRERAAIPEEILTARRFKDVYITPNEAVIYGLVHAVKEFALPDGDRHRADLNSWRRVRKVYEAHLGFYDTVVAAFSQKSALAAWGSSTDLFRMGIARITNDPAKVKAALAKPGLVLRRPAGSDDRLQRKSAAAETAIERRKIEEDAR